MSVIGDLLQLIERDIPIGRKHLRESHDNLENVAQYCEDNYTQAHDKRHALEETKNYTTQSLASVAYQINTLATNFLHLLDLEMSQLSDIESGVNHISQNVMIHKEKVARREIGVLTTNKTTTKPPGVKTPGIIFPEQAERPVKYVRRSIDYSQLDDIGHGVKTVQPQNPVKRRTSSTGSNKTATGQAGQAPTTKPPNPPIYSRTGGGGTLSRHASSPYRTPAPPVSPPALPSHYAPNYPKVQPVAQPPDMSVTSALDQRAAYSSLKAMGMPQRPPQTPPPAPPTGPPTGMVHPLASIGRASGYATQTSLIQELPQNAPATPPLPPMPDTSYGSDSPPPPPPESSLTGHMGNVSPPLPPPPNQGVDYQSQFTPPPPPMTFDAEGGQQYGQEFRSSLGMPSDTIENIDGKPKEYIEKVVAIYDYQKDKDDELTFTEGSLIYVVKKNDDGWWEGVMDGVTGLFPGNYVEPCI